MFIVYAFQYPMLWPHPFHYVIVLLASGITFARLIFAPMVRWLKRCSKNQEPETQEVTSRTIRINSVAGEGFSEDEDMELSETNGYFNNISFL